ncbi:SMC family ATPase [Candidatus Bathyarchaeota archaeon]|nr:SMC family ATPase [Candidatus Bathyarchaeota archaeon]
MFKIKSLKVAGFKRLDLPERLEFPDGRLLIHGRNESGKSTVLEAIHYALYGNALRPTKRASNEDVINYGRSEAIVELEFSIDDNEYMVRRELKKRGANTHILSERRPDGGLSRVTSGARSVNSQILEILHGIDSDALLNSCLVEQKELGKLEASLKQERIKAMSSLLNLEAFVDARDSLRKDRGELERTHSQTELRLQEAKTAAEDYEDAEKRKREAETRQQTIEEEQKTVAERLTRLNTLLKALTEMRRHKTSIDENMARLEGQEAKREQIKASLERAEKAEAAIRELETELPEAEEKRRQAEQKLAALDEVLGLEKEKAEEKTQVDKDAIRVEDASRALTVAEEAKKRVEELKVQLEEYLPVEEAQKLLAKISAASQRLADARRQAEQVHQLKGEADARLASLEASQMKVDSLEQRRRDLGQAKEAAQRYQRYGVMLIIGGFIGVMAGYLMSQLLYALGFVTVAGAYLYFTNNVQRIDAELDAVQAEREKMLGDISRVTDYRDQIAEMNESMSKSEAKVREEETGLVNAVGRLPERPREYRVLVNLGDSSSIETLRDAVQEDMQTLTKLRADVDNYGITADTYDERKANLGELEAAMKSHLDALRRLNEQIAEKQEETGVSVDSEAEIRGEHEEAYKKVTELETRLESNREAVALKPELQRSLDETLRSIERLSNEVKRSREANDALESEHGVSLEQEPEIEAEHREKLQESSRLETEHRERAKDMEESMVTMEQTRSLKEEYPSLQETNAREEFDLEAMRRAVKLLDATRDTIMSGVKQNVEKHMMQFLPALTDNRYSMARIDEERYVIQVYDREAKHWRGKGVFSGATQDQFSLALRLAFAISTIPSTRGARPGFIFLDEPLSGFDAQRRTGFMTLLRDELSRYFDQIIVVSHIEALSDEFPHHWHLDSGQLVET